VHSFYAAAAGKTTSAPGGGHILYGDTANDAFYIYTATDQVILPPQPGLDTVIDDAWNSAYTLAAGVQNLVLSGSVQVGEGNALDNLIIAQTGTATMSGGGGDDVFVDGSGPDTIIDPLGSGNDVIYNFKNGTDHVSLAGCDSLTSFADVQAAMTQVGADVVLNMGDGQTLTFRNESIGNFVAHDFYLPLSTAGMTLSFDDEFNSFSASANGVGTTWMTAYSHGERTLASNHEAEYYSDSSVGVNPFAINQGVLDITAAPTNPASNPLGLPYTSGAITTYKSFSQLYGYFEIRAEMPTGAGFWPAFWLLPENNNWPPELDVTEQIGGKPGIDYVTAHTNVGGFNSMISSAVDVGDTTQGFHTYGVDWTPTTITWYFDGQEIATCATPADMHSPMYMLVNLGVGGVGSWPGPTAPGATATMQVDYVRAYAYNPAAPSGTGSVATATPYLSATTLNFGTVHVGDVASQNLTLTNVATGEQGDTLLGGFGAVSAPFSVTGSLGSGLAADGSATFNVALATGTAGAASGTGTLDVSSVDPATGTTTLTPETITLTGTVDNYAVATVSQIGGSGSGSVSSAGSVTTINLGTIAPGGSATIDLAVQNSAAGPADLLSGGFTVHGATDFTNSGFGSFSMLSAGGADEAPSITLHGASSGVFTETIMLNATGSNASGYKGALVPQTLSVTGTISPLYMLSSGPNDVLGGAGDDNIVAASGQLKAGDYINGGGGSNTMLLQGGGMFDLAAPRDLLRIQQVTAQEGGGADAQMITLRNYDTMTLNVLPAADGASAGGIVINAGSNADTLNLGPGRDLVTLGGLGQTVNGGGDDSVYAGVNQLGAALDGGGTASDLVITSGGHATLGGNITDFGTISLAPSAGAVTLQAGTMPGVDIIGSPRGGDTITLASPTQSVVSGGPDEHIVVTGANAGAAVSGLGAGSVFEITTGGSVTLNGETGGSSNGDVLTVKFDHAGTLTLGGLPFITAIGEAGGDMLIAKGSFQTLTGAGDDTLVGYAGGNDMFRDTAASMNGDTIDGFTPTDAIDLTNVAFGRSHVSYSPAAAVLSVSDGNHAASINLAGAFTAAGFGVASDGHGGTMVTYHSS
jgi:beta-glucanase (GH16 family)